MARTTPPASDTTVLLRLPQVIARVGLSRSELLRRVAAHTFPSPVRLGARSTAWSAREVAEFCDALIAARDAEGRK